MCMEGIEHNPVVYELMSEMAFHDKKVEVEVNSTDVNLAFTNYDLLLFLFLHLGTITAV